MDERKRADRRDRVGQLVLQAGCPSRHLGGPERRGDLWRARFEGIRKLSGKGYIVLLTGSRGTGKTQLAVDLVMCSCRELHPALYTKALSFFLDVRETYQRDDISERSVIDRYRKPSLLVIDEVHVRGGSQFEDTLLTHLIDLRYDDGSDTILISNLNKQAFIESVGPSIADRARESGGVIVCDWESYRSGAKAGAA